MSHQAWRLPETPLALLPFVHLVTQLCLTLCNPVDCSLPGFSVHGDSLGKNTGMGYKGPGLWISTTKDKAAESRKLLRGRGFLFLLSLGAFVCSVVFWAWDILCLWLVMTAASLCLSWLYQYLTPLVIPECQSWLSKLSLSYEHSYWILTCVFLYF